MKQIYSYAFLCRFSVKHTVVLIRLFFGNLHNFIVFLWPSWILAAILNSLYGQNGTKYYLSCLLDIKCSPLRILSHIQEIQLIFLVFGGHL